MPIPGEEASLAKARQLAKRGNEAASIGQYIPAIKLFTDALKFDGTDYRFLGNRSYCFNQLGYHDRYVRVCVCVCVYVCVCVCVRVCVCTCG